MRDEPTLVEQRGRFRIELFWEQHHDWDYSHYGEFCELPYPATSYTAQARNDPKYGPFYVRNPNAWFKERSAYGAPCWKRNGTNNYGWFKLTEHPKEEVVALMESKGMSERMAWQHVLERWADLVVNLGRGDLYAIWMRVEVYFDDELVGESSLGGIEVTGWVNDHYAQELMREYDLIDSAMVEAEAKVEAICKAAIVADNNAA